MVFSVMLCLPLKPVLNSGWLIPRPLPKLGYESIERIELDHVWSAMRFTRCEEYRGADIGATRKRAAAAVAE